MSVAANVPSMPMMAMISVVLDTSCRAGGDGGEGDEAGTMAVVVDGDGAGAPATRDEAISTGWQTVSKGVRSHELAQSDRMAGGKHRLPAG
jgi:hypothetical protein